MLAMTLEDEIAKTIDDAVRRDPAILAAMTGERPFEGEVSVKEQFDILLAFCGGLREATLRLAREIDEPGSS